MNGDETSRVQGLADRLVALEQRVAALERRTLGSLVVGGTADWPVPARPHRRELLTEDTEEPHA